jgi:spore coat protein U-like protein
VNYDVSADNGNQPTGPNNRAKLGAALLRYDVFVDAGCTTQWKGARKISDTITWAASATGTITKQTSYWGCIVTAQTATSSGDYVDSVGLTLKYNGINISGSVPVNIYAPANCTVSTPAGNINLTYAAFGPQTSGSTSFAVTCTNSMPYTIATDATEGVLAGVRYTLTLSGTSSNGTGAPQPYTVTATIPAGQAGTCPAGSCTATRTHTLTITY